MLHKLGKKIAEAWDHVTWYHPGKVTAAIIVLFVAALFGGCQWGTVHNCRVYGQITERPTKVAMGTCYVLTHKGWRERGNTVEVRD